MADALNRDEVQTVISLNEAGNLIVASVPRSPLFFNWPCELSHPIFSAKRRYDTIGIPREMKHANIRVFQRLVDPDGAFRLPGEVLEYRVIALDPRVVRLNVKCIPHRLIVEVVREDRTSE